MVANGLYVITADNFILLIERYFVFSVFSRARARVCVCVVEDCFNQNPRVAVLWSFDRN